MTEPLAPCCASSFWTPDGGKPSSEPEGAHVPAGVEVIDAHVHLFPPGLFEAIWRWFDAHAWSIRYRLHAEQVIEFLAQRGVERFCSLLYAHKPGMARSLNRFAAETAAAHPGILPLGTVMPGESDAREIVREAFNLGLRGLKLHCHVQRMGADDPRLDEIYALSEAAGRPVLIHAGREPSLPGYGVDTRALCSAQQVERVLQRYPKLRLVVPHLGADEFEPYLALLQQYEHLYLDTTMSVGGYFQIAPPTGLFPGMASRLLYGTDFPNIPYAWDRELNTVLSAPMSAKDRALLLSGNALRLFG